MEQFLQQVASGLANGAIYACVALALVMIYVSTDHINFAQGEMAMFSTYISWQLMSWGVSFWFAFILAVVLSFILGVVIDRVILRPLHNAPVLSIWTCASLKPGDKNAPFRSITRVRFPASARISAFVPTAMIVVPEMATASAQGFAASTV